MQEHRTLRHVLRSVQGLLRAGKASDVAPMLSSSISSARVQSAVPPARDELQRIHSTVLQSNAATGRICIVYPDLQTVAKPVRDIP